VNQRVDATMIEPLIQIDRGSLADYRALARFHYRGEHPGAVTCILRAVLDRPTVVGRYLQRPSQRERVGVIVRSLPHLACEMRDLATNRRYRGLTLRESAIMLNREVRTISRVVIDPRFRGCGLAVRLVRSMLNEIEHGVAYIEALASMGRVNPMFERAGMARFDPPPRPADARLIDALEAAGIAPVVLCSRRMFLDRMNRLDSSAREFIGRELRRWDRFGGGRSRGKRSDPVRRETAENVDRIIARARASIFARPVYFLKRL
jgi:hypothetical protein